MHDSETARRRGDLKGWSLAAALGLVVAAFLVERLAPAREIEPPLHADPKLDASVVDLATEREDRGRGATSPSDIPARGWNDILLRVYDNIGEHRILALAAGITYYSILAIFPALAALVAIYGLFSNPASIAQHLDQLAGFLPGGALDVAREQLARISSKGGQTLGWTLIVGLAISLWSANAAMKSLFDTLNIVHNERERRGFIKLNLISLGFTLAGIAFILLALGALVIVPLALNYLGLSSSVDLLVRISRWPAMFVALALALACVYRFGPSRTAPRWRWITWGSVAATVFWIVASLLFSWYAEHFGTFNATYGSLGAAIGFMTWLWISAIVILLGAEMDAEMEHQTACDTTEGIAKRIGARGARMADTIGARRGR
jgi:membrane protein